ncbi:hypothetical protein DB88DRAFT_541050 [Papiliotrema laurentii]|uniref:HD/PDEase domain-containing protein n=1 Tax=Papiliotrema laurentii TaxID=5418 RepID=A0AAD9FNX9_PAPLA|nr:hypothetical protein DB88DRAFT_541050 [Papiliotrema laurentii]
MTVPLLLQRPLSAYFYKKDEPQRTEPSLISIPSTPVCQAALCYATERLPDWAVNHSIRTYAFGIVLAERAGWLQGEGTLAIDREALFLSAVMHELGMESEAEDCLLSLEFTGAIKARAFLLERSPDGNHDERRLRYLADETFEAIAMHSLELRLTTGPIRLIPALTALGAEMDFKGTYASDIHPEVIDMINVKWPRLQYNESLRALADEEVRRKPGCLFHAILPAIKKPELA